MCSECCVTLTVKWKRQEVLQRVQLWNKYKYITKTCAGDGCIALSYDLQRYRKHGRDMMKLCLCFRWFFLGERLNGLLIERIFTAQTEKAQRKAHVAELLQACRATPHTTTGTSSPSSSCMREKWELRSKLWIQPKPTAAQDRELEHSLAKKHSHVIRGHKLDAKRYAKRPKLHPGSCVCETLCILRKESPSDAAERTYSCYITCYRRRKLFC